MDVYIDWEIFQIGMLHFRLLTLFLTPEQIDYFIQNEFFTI